MGFRTPISSGRSREPRAKLEAAISAEVRCLAYPYGVRPDAAAARVVEEVYSAACATTLERVTSSSISFALPRVDAHYVRRPGVLHRVAAGRWETYLLLRAVGARGRRLLRSDHVLVEGRSE